MLIITGDSAHYVTTPTHEVGPNFRQKRQNRGSSDIRGVEPGRMQV